MAAALCVVLVGAAPAFAAELRQPASQTEPPRFFERSAEQVIGLAERGDKVVAEERRGGRLDPTAYIKGPGRWQVSFFRDGDQLVQVQVDDRSGALLEQWTGDQVAWTMARGYEGAFGRKLNAPYVWLPLCLLFLAPFVNLRRPFRLVHLDLLVLLAFGVSHVYFNRGEIETSVPLVYPVLGYLLLRTAGRRPAAARAAGAADPASPGEAARGGPRVPPLVPGRPERGGLERHRRGLRGRDRRRPGGGRRPALRRGLLGATWSAATPTGRSATWPMSRSSRRCRGAGAGTTCRRRTARRSPSTCWWWPGCCCSARGSGAGREGRAAGPRARLRLGGVPLHRVRARDELQRLAGGAGVRRWRCWRSRSRLPARGSAPRRAASRWASGAAAKFVPLALAPLFAFHPGRATRPSGRVRASSWRRCWRSP